MGAAGGADRVGTMLGVYHLDALLASDAVSDVFRATHLQLARSVALKVLRVRPAPRYLEETRAIQRLRHRNIVETLDLVELDDGTTFTVLELLDGMPLGPWTRTGIPLPRAIAVLVQICDGLEAAHRVGIVHRNLAPHNIVVIAAPEGELVKLLDFGVAALSPGAAPYAAPEPTPDGRGDIYALGAIMNELLRGSDPELDAVIRRCLELDPQRRYATVAELRLALAVRLTGRRPAYRPSLPPPQAELARPRDPQRAPWWVFASGALLAFGVGAAATASIVGSPAPPVAPAPARVEITLDARPPGAVFAGDSPTPLCHTRCTLEIDPRDPPHSYVIRAPGYRDASLAVDPAAPTRTYAVTLQAGSSSAR